MTAIGSFPEREQPRGGPRRAEVVAGIKDYIVRNHLKTGDLLPTESELCEAIGASRSSVREAVKTLAALDIVEVRHGHGTYVGRMSLAALVESLAFRGLLGGKDDHRLLLEIVDVRQTLEQGLAGQIVAAMDPDRVEDLTDLSQRMQDHAAEGEEFLELDREFHLTLMGPVGNDLLLQLTESFWQVQAIVTPTLSTGARDLAITASLHRAIAQAVTSRDESAFHTAIADHYAPVRAAIARTIRA